MGFTNSLSSIFFNNYLLSQSQVLLIHLHLTALVANCCIVGAYPLSVHGLKFLLSPLSASNVLENLSQHGSRTCWPPARQRVRSVKSESSLLLQLTRLSCAATPRLRFEILIDQFQRHEQPRPLPGSFPDLLMTTWNSPGCTNIMHGGNSALLPCDLFIHAQFKSNMI